MKKQILLIFIFVVNPYLYADAGESVSNSGILSSITFSSIGEGISDVGILSSIFSFVGEGVSEVGILSSVPGKEAVIFVPGVMGSPLYNSSDNQLLWDERVWVNKTRLILDPLDIHLDQLKLAENGVDPRLPGYQIKVSPIRNSNRNIEDEYGHEPLSTYEGLFKHLTDKLNYKLDNMDDSFNEGENLFCFVYDWRKDNSFNADLLENFINDVLRWTKKTRVNIIVHSMGGIITKSLVAKNTFNKNKINKIIFIATPHLGAPKILYTALTGRFFLNWENDMWVSNSMIMGISRNMPPTYQLLPSLAFHNKDLFNGKSIQNELYSSYFTNFGNDFDYAMTKEYLKNLVFKGRSLNSNLIDLAEDFQSSIKDVDFGNINLFNIVGSNTATMGKVRFEKNIIPEFNLNGDGTVPLKSAEIISNSIILADKTFYISGIKHQDLPSSESVLNLITRILNNMPTNGIIDPFISENPPASYSINSILALAACPIVLHAYDEFNNHTGPTSDSTWEENIPGSLYMPTELSDTSATRGIILPTEKEYRYEIYSQGYTSNFDLYLDEIKEGNSKTSLVFENVQIEPNTIAKTNISSVNTNMVLEVDLDGNGTTDQTITPTLVTSTKRETIQIPTDYRLYQNYPNPFNPTTKIQFNLPKACMVKINVLNILGEEIIVLLNEYRNAGNYEVIFSTNHLSSGVYFYKMQAGDYIEIKKMQILK